MPVPQGTHPAQPHSVRSAGVDTPKGSGLPERAEDRLSDQARLAARLSRAATQEPNRRNGSRVSPNRDIEGLEACPLPHHPYKYWRLLLGQGNDLFFRAWANV